MLRLLPAILMLFVCTPAVAMRPHISTEELSARMPIIFEGTVIHMKEVQAPVHDFQLYNQEKALAVRFNISKAWKGISVGKSTLYTRTIAEAACTGVRIQTGRKYIVWAEWDYKKQTMLFDICSHFMPAGTPDADILRNTLDRMFNGTQSMPKPPPH